MAIRVIIVVWWYDKLVLKRVQSSIYNDYYTLIAFNNSNMICIYCHKTNSFYNVTSISKHVYSWISNFVEIARFSRCNNNMCFITKHSLQPLNILKDVIPFTNANNMCFITKNSLQPLWYSQRCFNLSGLNNHCHNLCQFK